MSVLATSPYINKLFIIYYINKLSKTYQIIILLTLHWKFYFYLKKENKTYFLKY